MKNLQIIPILLFLLILSSCLQRREPMMHERGIVVEKQYAPDFNASGTSFDIDGSIGFHNLHQDERYIVVFKCEHNVVFSINRNYLYAKLNKNDSVVIDYYELVDNGGIVQKYDFVNAEAINKP